MWAFRLLIMDEIDEMVFRYKNGKLIAFDPYGKYKKTHAEYTNVRWGSDSNVERTETYGIRDKNRLRDHLKRHGKDVGAKDENSYNQKGCEFMSKPLNSNMEEIITPIRRLRYDYSTNEFGVADRTQNLHTYYYPKTKTKYWEVKIKEYGKR